MAGAFKVRVQVPDGEEMDFDAVPAEPIRMLKSLIATVKPDLGPSDVIQFSFKGQPVTDDATSLVDLGYQHGDVLCLSRDEEAAVAARAAAAAAKGRGKGIPPAGRPGAAASAGFEAVKLVVAGCSNEKTNGCYEPAPPHNGKAVWYKAPSDDAADGESKDRGERAIYFAPKQERWFIGDALDDGGFTFGVSPGQSPMPPLTGWQGGAILEVASLGAVVDGDLDAGKGYSELSKLRKIEPWADQETCLTTLIKVLGNIVASPTEAKFQSIKVDNAAIQKRILRFDGARGFLEAIGFREKDGALILPMDRVAQAKSAHELLQGFGSDAQYLQIRKERHAIAAEEAKKEAARPKRRAPPQDGGGGGGGGGGGSDRGPMRG